MTALSAAGITSIGTAFVLKTFLETGIKESIGSVYKKQLEDHKFLLKNSEKVFQFKLDASKSLYKIFHEMLPKRSHPDMDWYEASEDIASSFRKHEDKLDNFLCEYQSTLSPEILTRVRSAINACSDGRFEFYWDSAAQNAVCTDTAREKAEELYNALNEAVEMLRKEVHDMISIPNG
jgi:hypothetical protein